MAPRPARRHPVFIAMLAGALALAGCARTPRVETAPPAPPVVVPEAPKPEAPKPVNRIAVLVPLSGTNAAVGQSLANAAALALADTKATGIVLKSYDTAPGAAAAAQRAMADGATLILGPLLSNDVAAVRGVTAARNIPLLSFSNDAALAGDDVYVLGFQPAQSVTRVVNFVRGRGVERFAALMPVGIYGQRASVAFTRAVQASGGRVVAIRNFERDSRKLVAAARAVTDYEARLKKASVALTRPDGTIAPVASRLPPVAFQALMIGDSGTVAGAFTTPLAQYGASGSNIVLMGTELWNTEPALARVPGLRGALFAAVPDARFGGLATRYRERFGGTPSRLSSLAYDAMLLAVSAGARWPVGASFPQAVLTDPQGFSGIDGIFRFRGNVAERGLEVQQVAPTGFVTVSAAPTAF